MPRKNREEERQARKEDHQATSKRRYSKEPHQGSEEIFCTV
jgi:hypothetical protein